MEGTDFTCISGFSIFCLLELKAPNNMTQDMSKDTEDMPKDMS